MASHSSPLSSPLTPGTARALVCRFVPKAGGHPRVGAASAHDRIADLTADVTTAEGKGSWSGKI